MEKSYISPEYQKQLDDLAETLMATRREQLILPVGQLALFEVEHGKAA